MGDDEELLEEVDRLLEESEQYSKAKRQSLHMKKLMPHSSVDWYQYSRRMSVESMSCEDSGSGLGSIDDIEQRSDPGEETNRSASLFGSIRGSSGPGSVRGSSIPDSRRRHRSA